MAEQGQGSAPGRIIRRAECARLVELHASTIRRLEARGAFPQRVMLTDFLVGWWLDEVLAWKAARQRAPLPRADRCEAATGSEAAAR